MFEFRKVDLMNWAYWPTIDLPLDQGTIMISGPNGSGKTTFLDALRTLLRVPRLSANRKFTDYLMGDVETAAVRAVVTNTVSGSSGHRPFEFKGYKHDDVTLACIMHRRAGRWEKRFAILDGNVPFSELRELRRSQALAPAAYSYELHQAGFTESLLKVLALEQGQTDKLCEKTPRELLELLLDVNGDMEVIDRYKDARRNYQEANLEVTQLGARLAAEQGKLVTAQKAAENYARYTKLSEELVNLEGLLLPQAEYKQALRLAEEAEMAIKDFHARLQPVDREVMQIETELDNAETELERRQNELISAQEIKVSMEKEERELDISLNSLVRERNELVSILTAAKDAKPEPIEPLLKKAETARREVIRLELQQDDKKQLQKQVRTDAKAMEAPRHKIYPQFVEEFAEVLKAQKIKHSLLCDQIDISSPDWQLAVESILGRDRFTVLVSKDQQLKTRELAEQCRYRAYIAVAAKPAAAVTSTPKGSALEAVAFSDGAIPEWIIDRLAHTRLVGGVKDGMALGTAAVSVTRNGYRQDARGGVSIAVDSFYCGDLGQSAQKNRLRAEISTLDGLIADLGADLSARRGEEEELRERIRVQEALLKANESESRKNSLDEEIVSTNVKHKQALGARREAEQKLLAALDTLNNFERDCADKRRVLMENRSSQSGYIEEIKDSQKTIAEMKQKIRDIEAQLKPKLLSTKALEDIPDADELTPRQYAVQSMLEDFDVIPDMGAVEVYDHHKLQYDRQRKIYDDHETGLKNWEKEFKLARSKYNMVVEHTIREYQRNVTALSEMAGVKAEVVMPRMGTEEDSLEAAELKVRFGFDGKDLDDIRSSTHSGGQRVVASLILLMSMATSGGAQSGGFFIIDEPFAHLSIERIDDVSRFLDKSQCQFILTSPTTHNVNVFNAARLQLNFRIKKAEEDYAPIPTVIRR